MNAAFDLISLSLLAVLPMIFVVQFFGAHSRKAAWSAPARHTVATTTLPTLADVIDLDTVRSAEADRTAALAA